MNIKTFFTFLFSCLAFSMFGQNPVYCNSTVTHFAGDPPSAIVLTIQNTGPTSMGLIAESADADPIDDVTIPGISGVTISPAMETSPGVFEISLTWTSTPPSTFLMNVLWSKVSFPGNWQLSAGDFMYSFNTSCAPSEPSPYCDTPTLHFAGDPPSEILLTIQNTGPSSMEVVIESADADPVDALVVLNGSGATISAEMFPAPGVIVRTLTWGGPPPTDVMLNLLWSKVSFGGNWQLSMTDISVPFFADCTPLTAPATNAPEPICDPADVVSVYGDFYPTNIATNYDPNWGQSGFGMVNPSYDPGTGEVILAYPNFNYQGTELTTTDLSGMDYLHFDVWTAADAGATILQVTPVQMGPLEFLVDVPFVSGEWTKIVLPMSDFVGMDWTDVFQMKFAANGPGSTTPVDIYLDNIYFSTCDGTLPTAPTTNAPEPTCDPGNVVSIYGDFYPTNIATNYDPNWGQSGFGMVDPNYDPGTGNPVLAYPNFNYQGTELTTTDLSGMDNLNFDIWTAADPSATFLQVSPVQMGPLEFLVDVPYVQGEWTHVSIPMADFVGMDWTDVFQMKFAANGPGSTVPVDIYLDNIYFSTCAPPCAITNFTVTDPVCGDGLNADDSYFTATFDVVGGSGNYVLINPANNVSYGFGTGAMNGQVSFLGQASITGTMEGETALVELRDAGNSVCMAGPLTITLPFCPPCTLTSAPCNDCMPDSENTDIEIASLGVIPFAGGPGASASFDAMTNSGTAMLTAGTDQVFAGFDIGDFTLPADLNDLCITADVDLVSGSVPFTIEFRIEKGGGPFGGGSALAFNADIDGPGVCSIGGSQADGIDINGFTYDGGSDYSIVVAIANFAGPAALPDDVIINVSNISFSYCAPIPICTLTAGDCVTCGTCEESVDVDLTAGTAFNVAQQFGPGFCCFQENTPGTYDNGTNMGTLTLPAGGVNAFSVSGINDLNLPDYIADICLTADIDIVSGAYPFILEFRLENGTGAPGNGGQAMTFDVMVDGQGMCSVGGSGSVDGVPVNGFVYVPGANYSVVIGLADFSGNPIPEDIEVAVSNISLNVCAADDVAPTLVCPNSEELLMNGDFSDVTTPGAFPISADFANWTEYGETFDDAFTADQSLKLFGTVSGVYQDAPVAEGEWLCSYAEFLTQSTDNIIGGESWAEIKIEFRNAGGIVQDVVLQEFDRFVPATANVWTKVGGCFQAPAGATIARTVINFLNFTNEPGSILVDNVTMQKINPVYFEANADGCTADATITNPVPADACGVVTFTNTFNGTDDASGNYPLGKTLVTYNAVDANGNESFCSILVEVGDMTAPTIACPGDIVMDNDFGVCGAVVTFDVTGDDICDFVISQTAGIPSGGLYPVGETMNTFVITDDAGLTATCSFLVTVNDVEGPMIDCPSEINVQLEAGECEEFVFFDIPFMDNCGTVDAEMSQAVNEALVSTALDCQFNTSNHLRYFENNLLVPIEITQVNFGIFAAGVNETVTVNVYMIGPGAPFQYANMVLMGTTDVMVPSGMNQVILTAAVEATIPVGMNYVLELKANNTTNFVIGYNASGETESSYISGNNPVPCVSLEPTDIDILGPFANLAVVLYSNAEGGPFIEQTGGLPSGSSYPIGTTTNTFIATDVYGNTTECVFDVNVFEFENGVTGVLACNDNVNISLDQNCELVLNADMLLEGDVYGCYDDYIIEVSGGVVGSIITEPGTYTVTITDPDTDNKCWSTINVESKAKPLIDCQSALCPIDMLEGEWTVDDNTFSPGAAWAFDGGAPNDNILYDVIKFVVEVPGTYTLTMTPSDEFDGIAGIYADSFDPDMPAMNLIGGDDDVPGIFESEPDFMIFLDAGTYFLVSSTWGAGQMGVYTWSFSGPGDLLSDCEVKCYELDALLSGDLEIPDPVVTSCIPYELFYSDAVDYDDCGTTTVTRTYLAENANGTSTCEVIFEIDPVSVALDIRLPEALVVLTCNDGTDPEDIVAIFDNPLTTDNPNTAIVENNEGYIYAYPTYEVNGHPQKVDNNVCNVYAAYTDQELDACAEGCNGNRKVIRTWTLVDWCTLEISNYIQTIKAVDTEAPTLITKDITVSTDAWGCEASFEAPLPWELHDNCDSNPEYRISGPAGVTIEGNFEEGYFVIGAPKGVHTFNYIAYDCCDNEASYPFTVTVLDITPPVVVAKQNVVVSLTSGSTNGAGLAKLYAESIDNGSYDGCSSTVKLEIRRDSDICDVKGNLTYNDDGHPQDGSSNPNAANYDPDGGAYVKFCCEDLTNAVVDVNGDGVNDPGYVKVWLRVWDDGDMDGILGTPAPLGNDNYNEAWAYVKVEDKLAPAIQCPPDVTLTCDMDYTDLNMTGSASAFGSCGGVEVEYNDIIISLNSCNEGFVRRRWTVVDRTDIFCDQTITLEDLAAPVNVSFAQVGDFTAANCPDMIALGEPTWVAGPCDVLGYTLKTDTFKFEDGACYKLVNHWTVINWCDYEPNNPFWNGEGLWEHTQVIKVTDETKPVLEDCEDKMYAINDHSDSDGDGEVCEAKITLTNSATDEGSENCPTGWLKWQVFVDLWGDGTNDLEYSSFLPTFDTQFNDTNGNGIPDVYVSPTANGETVSIPLPDIVGSMSNHKVSWKVTDGCNNVTTCDTEFMVVDKKAPTPYCVSLSTAVMDMGANGVPGVEIWASDFNIGSYDNCTAQEDLLYSFSGTDYVPSKVFDCDDVANSPVEVQMYVWDEKGNNDFCVVFLTVVDNQELCSNAGKADISGMVETEEGTPVAEVEVTLNSNFPEYPLVEITDEDGVYAFLDLPLNSNYELTASKDVDYMNGVSTLDLVKIQRHILGLEALDSPYKLIAADVNADDDIKASDLTQLRKLILGVITDLPTNESWRFVDAGQQMDMGMDLEDVTYEADILNLQTSMMNMDMVAVKVGDVTNNATTNFTSQNIEVRSSKSLVLTIEEREVVAGEIVEVAFTSEDFSDVYGYQFTMELNGLEFSDVEQGTVSMTEGNVGVLSQNIVTVSYNSSEASAAGKADVLFTARFKALQNGTLSNMIDITSKVTKSEAYISTSLNTSVGNTLEIRDVVIATRGEVTEVAATELYQNEPNPFVEQTVIGFNLSTAGAATMTVFDVTGKVIVKENINGVKGYNTVNFTANELGISGVLYYTLESGEFTATKKMIIIE